MAHQISTVTINGKSVVEAMYANKPAWHRLGVVFDDGGNEAPNSEQTIKLAHLDWTVDKRKLVDMDGHDSGSFGNYRTDTNDCLGVVSDRYTVLQNIEAFTFLDSLVEDVEMTYESAFALNGGRQICLLARISEVDEYVPGDHGLRYIMLRTSHDGSTEIDMVPTSVRVVCANTIKLAMVSDKKLSVRHSGNIKDRLEQAKHYLAMFSNQFTLYNAQAAELYKMKYTEATKQKFLDELFPVPESDKAKTRHFRKVNEFNISLEHPSNNIAGMNGTYWQLVNSLSYAIDHGEYFDQYRGDTLSKRENKFTSTIFGKNSDIKNKAIKIALSL